MKKVSKALNPRVTEYDPTFHDQEGYTFALLGKTAKEIAVLFGVSHQTIKNWFKRHPSFFASVNRGRAYADAKVAEGLFKRATGFEIDSEKIVVVSDGAMTGAHVERLATKTYFPPDPGAAMNWLKNRQPNEWRDKIDLGLPPEITLRMNLDGETDNETES